jgi:hypothetical protein
MLRSHATAISLPARASSRWAYGTVKPWYVACAPFARTVRISTNSSSHHQASQLTDGIAQ